MPESSVVSRNGTEGEGCIARGIPLACSTLGVWISGSCGGGLSSDIEERVDKGDGASYGKKEGSPRAKGIGLTSRVEVGGGLTALGVISHSGSSGDIWGVIAGNGVNENVITSRPETTEGC